MRTYADGCRKTHPTTFVARTGSRPWSENAPASGLAEDVSRARSEDAPAPAHVQDAHEQERRP